MSKILLAVSRKKYFNSFMGFSYTKYRDSFNNFIIQFYSYSITSLKHVTRSCTDREWIQLSEWPNLFAHKCISLLTLFRCKSCCSASMGMESSITYIRTRHTPLRYRYVCEAMNKCVSTSAESVQEEMMVGMQYISVHRYNRTFKYWKKVTVVVGNGPSEQA